MSALTAPRPADRSVRSGRGRQEHGRRRDPRAARPRSGISVSRHDARHAPGRGRRRALPLRRPTTSSQAMVDARRAARARGRTPATATARRARRSRSSSPRACRPAGDRAAGRPSGPRVDARRAAGVPRPAVAGRSWCAGCSGAAPRPPRHRASAGRGARRAGGGGRVRRVDRQHVSHDAARLVALIASCRWPPRCWT